MAYAYRLGNIIYIDGGEIVTKISLVPPCNDTPRNIPPHILTDLKEKYSKTMKPLTQEEMDKLLGY